MERYNEDSLYGERLPEQHGLLRKLGGLSTAGESRVPTVSEARRLRDLPPTKWEIDAPWPVPEGIEELTVDAIHEGFDTISGDNLQPDG